MVQLQDRLPIPAIRQALGRIAQHRTWFREPHKTLTAWLWRQAWVRRATRLLSRISAQLYFGIGTAVALTLGASLVAWLAFDQVGDAQSEVNETSLPQLAGSFAVALQGSALAVAAPRLAATASADELAEVGALVQQQRLAFEIQLSELTQHSGERFDNVRIRGGALITNIEALRRLAEERIALRSSVQALHGELSDLDAAGALRDRGALAIQHLESAHGMLDAEALKSIGERFEALVATLRGNPATIARLRNLGLASNGIIELRRQQLALAQRQTDLVNQNRRLAADLLNAVEGLVDAATDGAAVATGASADAIDSARTQLLLINGVSIVGAILIAWLLIGRFLVPRLQALSNRMMAMAEGDLEDPVEIGGRDEVADLAAALEVFRRHALEVQRLNLVEKLAEELRGKNDQLESALEELRRAQNQIVAREKLAGLGELTAGVAHEIRNPLNFVYNFSEASAELMEELLEELRESQNGFTEAQKALLEPLCADVCGNLERIRNHGGRAERIVRDMLKMGGSTGSRELTSINNLLDDQINLAVGAMQADNGEPPVDVERDFDRSAGKIEIVSQDIGRVVQNLIINAWHATSERRRAEEQAGQPYQAAVVVGTRRLDDRLEVTVRDNGTGIPDEAVDKIFNPFFTTKPTDQGTGLGLSLCNDIVRGHGGSIRVETELGSHTKVIVDLPCASVSAA